MNTEAQHGTRLEEVVESFLDRLRAGDRPTTTEYEAKYPDLAAEIRDLFPALMVMEEGRKCVEDRTLGPTAQLTEALMPQQLGEYRLLRLIGRGGMGVVYEAWQESLGRQVALKILPFNALVQPEHLERFHLEARAAARLHHTNIVPVFGVGEHEGLHYYAMQFIHGQPLDVILDEVRRMRDAGNTLQTPPMTLANTVALQLLNERSPADEDFLASTGSADNSSNLIFRRESPYFEAIARIGLQAAEAVDYAHGQGVLHRDVKPSNLLLDCESRVWITDFGLAKMEGSDLVTEPGALLGTLRYMAPERFHGLGDARSDVYGLGVTLYELLTLRPAFEPANRAVLSEQIAHVEPPPPRRLEPRIPRDLETIVLKAIAKEPNRRYTTAGEMANDLSSFLADRPIRARRITWAERFWRWRRRNRLVANLAVLIGALILLMAIGAGWVARERMLRETALDAQVSDTLDGAEARLAASQWPEAEEAMLRVERLLAAAGRSKRPSRLAELRNDLAMAQRLEDIYSQPKRADYFTGQEQDGEYARAFQDYGIDLAALPVEEAARRIQARSIRLELVRSLDFWSAMRRRAGNRTSPDWQHLLEVAKAADPDRWRNELREAFRQGDRQALQDLAVRADIRQLPPGTLHLLGNALFEVGLPEQAVNLLRQAQHDHPQDLWLNDALGWLCQTALRPPKYDDSIRFYTAALAVRPHNPYITHAIGWALLLKGSVPEAITEFSNAIEVKPDYLDALWSRGWAYTKLGKWKEALDDFSGAIDVDRNYGLAWFGRGWASLSLGRPDQAYADANQAIHLFHQSAHCWTLRGLVLARLGRWNEAIADYSRAIELDGRDAPALQNRAAAYCETGEWKKAAGDHAHLLELEPTNPWHWFGNAILLLKSGNNEGYRQVCGRMLKLFGPSTNVDEIVMLAHTCALAPEGLDNTAQVRQLAERRLALTPPLSRHYLWSVHILGLAYYRAGEYANAVKHLQKALEDHADWEHNVLNWLVLAMAHHRLKHEYEARRWLDEARHWIEHHTGSPAPLDQEWLAWQAVQILFGEAEELLKTGGPGQ